MNINFHSMNRDNKSSELVMMPEYLKGKVRSDKYETNRLIDIYVEGINAEAKVLKIEEAGVYADRNYYKLSLEVRPYHTKKFKATGFAPVSGNLIPKPGDLINIKYNSTDTGKFVII